jgi:hypothetical protein
MEHLEVRFVLLDTLILREVLGPHIKLIRAQAFESFTMTTKDSIELHGDILITL